MSLRAPLFALLILLPTAVFARAAGINGFTGKTAGSTCASCHSGGALPTVSLSGPNNLAPYEVGTYLVTITAAVGSGVVAGFDATVGGVAAPGTVLTPGAGSYLLMNEVTHMIPGAFDAGVANFSFKVTPGALNGSLTIYVAGLAANGNGTEVGDNGASITRTITVFGDAGTPPVDTDGGGTGGSGGSGGTGGGSSGGAGGGTISLGRPGGFVDGGCSTTGGASLAALLALVLLTRQRRSTNNT